MNTKKEIKKALLLEKNKEILDWLKASYFGCIVSYFRKFGSNPLYTKFILDFLLEEDIEYEEDLHPQGNLSIFEMDDGSKLNVMFFLFFDKNSNKKYKTTLPNFVVVGVYSDIFSFEKSIEDFVLNPYESCIYENFLNLENLLNQEILKLNAL